MQSDPSGPRDGGRGAPPTPLGLGLGGALGALIALGAAVFFPSGGCIFLAEVDPDLLDAGQGAGDAGPGGGGGAGGCTGDGMCNDGVDCTVDTCVAGGCVFTPKDDGAPCSDADACNGDETCNGGQCVAGAPPAVDDGLVCTTDACEPSTGEVTHDPIASCLEWTPLPARGAPSPRYDHSAVWTGSSMIVWGGAVPEMEEVTATGGVYDPATETWTPTSTTGAPSARRGHTAVWTGTRMLVWGGAGADPLATGGGIYDPVTDTWTAMATIGEPAPRTFFASVWTGAALVTWGGFAAPIALDNGGIYDVSTNTWSAVTGAGAPGSRFGHTAVWTGDRVIFWGGQDLADWNNTGGMLDPTDPPPGGDWIGATTTNGAPSQREGHAAVWAETAMIVWGGWNGGQFTDTGGTFDPIGGAWVATSVDAAPAPRQGHAAVWTGEAMVVWGGYAGESDEITFGDGGRFTPSGAGGAWTPIPAVSTLSARRDHTAVWTGSEIIIWGGRTGFDPPTNTGAIGVP
jgi:hypothetical protein